MLHFMLHLMVHVLILFTSAWRTRLAADKYILAIDLGTSMLKVALVSTNGDVAVCESEPQKVILVANGGAEQDPADWWTGVLGAAKLVLSHSAVSADAIVAVCCTTQWSGTVAVDEAGDPLMNAIIWMDSRGAPYVNRVTGGRIGIEGYGITKLARWLRRTGGIPGHAGKDSLAHILFLKNERSLIYDRAFKFLEPKDYLNLRLTGKFAAGVDSIILHWVTNNQDIARVRYDDGLLKLAGIAREKLPELKRAVDVLGTLAPDVARELGLDEDTRVIMGTPDVQSAALGSGAVRDYESHLYIGTSAWMTCHVPFKKTDLSHNMASLPSAIPNRYLLTNEQESAGMCLTYLRDNLFFPDDELQSPAPTNVYQAFDRLAAGVPAGSDKLIFTPWLYGERTPVENHSIRGGFFNQSLRTTRAHMIRAVLEGVAYNARWLLGAVEGFTRHKMETLNFIGGGANSELWCQILADVMDRPINQVRDPVQANLRGAAFLAAAALGEITFDDIHTRVKIARTYTPTPEHRRVYDQLFAEFLNIYQANKKIYARLNAREQAGGVDGNY